MSADQSLFVFGDVATPEHLAHEARARQGGLWHGARILPTDPAPCQPVTVLVESGGESGVERVTVRYTTDGTHPTHQSQSVLAERIETRWDDLGWGFVDAWTAELPAQSEDTFVHYLVEGETDPATQVIYADAGSRHPLPSLFGYGVDRFQAPSWVRDAVIYQIFVDRFFSTEVEWGRPVQNGSEIYGGSLDGVTAKLPYLADLGITALWLTPIFPSETYHAYDAIDFESIAPRVGGERALKTLVEQAHALKLAVLLDFAPNHCSWRNRHFMEATSDPGSPFREWFTFTEWPNSYRMFFSSRYLPELNTRNPEVVRYLSDVAASYIERFGVDGFRLDYALGPPLVFWSQLRLNLKSANPDTYLLAESTTGPGGLRLFEGRLDGCLDFPMLQTFHRFFLHGSIDATTFHSIVQHNLNFYGHGFSTPTFLDNHDMNRFLWVAAGDKRKLKLAATCQFTLPQPPVIYYGTEVGVSQEIDVSEIGHEAARLPMRWGEEQDRDVLEFYRTLIDARRSYACLRAGVRHALVASGALYVYQCSLDGESVTVALNNCDKEQDVEIPGVTGNDLLSGLAVREHLHLQPLQSMLIAPAITRAPEPRDTA